MKSKKKIVIVRPYTYCGGTLVLDLLCRLLRTNGVDARIFYVEGSNPGNISEERAKWEYIKDSIHYIIYSIFKTHFDNSESNRAIYYKTRFNYNPTMSGLKRQILPFFSKSHTIVVYPEVFYGNFLNAHHVVRWLLYNYKFSDDPKAYSKNDLFIAYRKVFNDYRLNPEEKVVTLSYFNRKLYCQYNFGERKENCYLIRKGRNRKDLPTSFDGPVIDFGMSEEQIVAILNEHKYCFLYDTQTFYGKIAAVCGCIPIVICEPGKTKRDYLSKEECENSYGIAYANTEEEIQFAISTRQQLIEELNYDSWNDANIKKFIKYIDEKF